ncbi:Techylectin-5B [Lucilia cuprina]|nr:Techylectin-5B [Lucilia cuprina]
MRLSSLLMLIIVIILYNIFHAVNSAGVPNAKLFASFSSVEENLVKPQTELEYLNNFDYKLETLSQTINKMDNSIQNLQEKSHTWAIFQHHINSWNEGMRILENKLDILKRTHEEQQQLLQKLEQVINTKHPYHQPESLLEDIKQFLNTERKTKNEISSKINNILRLLQMSLNGNNNNNERKSHKLANIMAPIGISPTTFSQQFQICSNISHKLDQRLNNISHQMALQKDLKQLNALERRNSKSLENINQVLVNQLDKQDEITTRLQKSNECCYSLSSELTTFTESSDILLKRIEKLVRNVSEKLNDIEVTTNTNNNDEHIEEMEDNEVEEEEEFEKEEHKINETYDNAEDLNDIVEHKEELEKEESTSVHNVENESVTEIFEYDDGSHDVEFIRPNLNGCHELVDELTKDDDDDSVRIDGIYKFSTPDINEAERDFNERYCVFPTHSHNNTSNGLPWTVIQRRGPYQEQENFNRSWSEYRNGFGHLSRDFWFGNEFIHRLVYHDDYELRIELEDFDGVEKWAEYAVFRIDSEKYNYNLLIGEYRGTVEDAMKYHNDNDFSTYDKRNDKTVDACCSCALGYASGWWFDNCSEANLNGLYHHSPLNHNYIGIMWELWHGDYSLKKTRMMIRPRTRAIHNTVVHSQDYHDYTEDP